MGSWTACLAPDVHGGIRKAIVVGTQHDARARAVRGNRDGRVEREVVGDGRVEVHARRADPLCALPRIVGAVRERRGKAGLARLELVAVHVGDGHLPGVAALGVQRITGVGDALAPRTVHHAAVPDLVSRRVGDHQRVRRLASADDIGCHRPAKDRRALDAHGIHKAVHGKVHDFVAFVEFVCGRLGWLLLHGLLLGGRRAVGTRGRQHCRCRAGQTHKRPSCKQVPVKHRSFPFPFRAHALRHTRPLPSMIHSRKTREF